MQKSESIEVVARGLEGGIGFEVVVAIAGHQVLLGTFERRRRRRSKSLMLCR